MQTGKMRPMPFVLLPRNVLEGLRECAHQYVHVKKVSALALMDFHQEFVTLVSIATVS